jgi:type III secretory pathway lipoprotein EscJ
MSQENRINFASAQQLNDTILTISGVGGLQVLVEDPSGNPIELNQPAENRP